MAKKFNWVTLFLHLFIIGLISLTVIGGMSIENPIDTKNVECYDKYSNLIQGQTCIEKVYSHPFLVKFTPMLALLSPVMIMFLVLLYVDNGFIGLWTYKK